MPAAGNGVATWLRTTVGRGLDDTGGGTGTSGGWGGPDDVTVLPAPRTESTLPAASPAPAEPDPSASGAGTPQQDELPAERAPATGCDHAGTGVGDPAGDPTTEGGTYAAADAAGDRTAEQRSARWRRRPRRLLVASALLLALALVAVLVVAVTGGDAAVPAVAPSPGSDRPSPPVAALPPRAELPRGGTTIFPRHRVVAFYGTPDTDVLGVLGEGTPEEAADRLDEAAAAFATPDREVQPTMEIIATVADGSPGPDGNYSHDVDPAAVRRYIDVARAHGQLVVLDLQPGSSDFLTVAERWEPFLSEPDVSLALDPEWRMEPGEAPGEVIGNVSAAEINQVSDWLANIVRTRDLPQKMFVLHQFTPDMIGAPETIATPPELAVVQHIDGFGAPANKLGKYQELHRPQHLHPGFKLFYDEDTPMLTPEQTLGLDPAPEFVTYQ
jgi:hypothetical protein